MINEYNVKRFCCENISLIENYDKAISDTENTWHCHHRLETKCPLYKPGMNELKEWNLYYNRPASELIFLTCSEHRKLHNKGRKLSEEHKLKLSKAAKGRKHTEDVKQKISESHKGHIPWNKGKRFSDEYKHRLSDAHKGHAPTRGNTGMHWKLIDGKRIYY